MLLVSPAWKMSRCFLGVEEIAILLTLWLQIDGRVLRPRGDRLGQSDQLHRRSAVFLLPAWPPTDPAVVALWLQRRYRGDLCQHHGQLRRKRLRICDPYRVYPQLHNSLSYAHLYQIDVHCSRRWYLRDHLKRYLGLNIQADPWELSHYGMQWSACCRRDLVPTSDMWHLSVRTKRHLWLPRSRVECNRCPDYGLEPNDQLGLFKPGLMESLVSLLQVSPPSCSLEVRGWQWCSSPSGTITVNAGNAVTTAAAVPTDAQPQTNTDCARWYFVSLIPSAVGDWGLWLTKSTGEIRRLLLVHLPQVQHFPERLLLPEPAGGRQLLEPLGRHLVLRRGRGQHPDVFRLRDHNCGHNVHKDLEVDRLHAYSRRAGGTAADRVRNCHWLLPLHERMGLDLGTQRSRRE